MSIMTKAAVKESLACDSEGLLCKFLHEYHLDNLQHQMADSDKRYGILQYVAQRMADALHRADTDAGLHRTKASALDSVLRVLMRKRLTLFHIYILGQIRTNGMKMF